MIIGIDCADVDENLNPDWAKAKANAGLAYAFVRATFGAASDVAFKQAWPAIKAVGVPRGAYLFLRYGSLHASAEVQAAAFINTVGDLGPGDFPPVIDIEFGGNGRKLNGLGLDDVMKSIRTAWGVLNEHYGTAPMLYTSYRVWFEDLDNAPAPDLAESPLWLAKPWPWARNNQPHLDGAFFADGQHDPAVPVPLPRNWWIHQYQGDALGFPGFSSTVDLNRFRSTSKGGTGDHVKWLQRRLGLDETGTFDDTVGDAVVAHQTANGLVADGVVGPKTFASVCWG